MEDEIASLPGMEDEIEKSLERPKATKAGNWTDIFDGKICQKLPSADGSRLFFPTEEDVAGGELRIGVTMGMDCVSLVAVVCDKPAAHKIGGFGSHSHTNFCTLCWIIQDVKSTPEAFKENGMDFRNAQTNDITSYKKEYLKCTTKSARDAFVKHHATRFSELHRLPYFDICEMIVIDPMHNLFLVVKTHFYHIWVQLKVLQKTKELRSFHAILSKLKLPAHLGRLPSLIGEPAGGSLTADQWRIFATVVAPLVIPQLWVQYIPEESPEELARRRASEIATTLKQKKEAAAAARKAKAAEVAEEQLGRGKRVRRPTKKAAAMDIDPEDSNGVDTGALSEDDSGDEYGINPTQSRRRKRPRKPQSTEAEDEARDSNTPVNPHPDDPANFLKLCTAIKSYVRESITEDELVLADKLYREYCLELVELYGPGVIRPNHHYATHTPQNIRNYGPLHECWTFLFERLNKVLKSYRTLNHAGGELETSFFREFQRTIQQSRLLAQGVREPSGSELRDAVHLMYRATDDDRGTVQGLARNLDLAQEDAGIGFQLSPRFEKLTLPPDIYASVLQNLQLRYAAMALHSYLSLAPSPDSKALYPQAFSFDHAISPTPEVLVFGVGELSAVLVIKQDDLGIGTQTFGYVRWFRPASIDLSGTIWETFGALMVQIWAINEYLAPAENGPNMLINLQDIASHVARLDVLIQGRHHWATIPVGTVSQ
ncbi:hypothetical protein B0H14DRAFT_3787754 [Mycena olivaceomarginata]|nr:hypothetical protein B0H14DRAFT_3787754 [Mycena olivaceomarginata]